MDKDLGSRYVKMCRKEMKTPVAYMGKLSKIVKMSPDHNFQLKAQI